MTVDRVMALLFVVNALVVFAVGCGLALLLHELNEVAASALSSLMGMIVGLDLITAYHLWSRNE